MMFSMWKSTVCYMVQIRWTCMMSSMWASLTRALTFCSVCFLVGLLQKVDRGHGELYTVTWSVLLAWWGHMTGLRQLSTAWMPSWHDTSPLRLRVHQVRWSSTSGPLDCHQHVSRTYTASVFISLPLVSCDLFCSSMGGHVTLQEISWDFSCHGDLISSWRSPQLLSAFQNQNNRSLSTLMDSGDPPMRFVPHNERPLGSCINPLYSVHGKLTPSLWLETSSNCCHCNEPGMP